MKRSISLILSFCLTSIAWSQALDYPDAKKDPVVLAYHGTEIKDNYIWMENLEDATLQNWMQQQDKLLKKFVRETEDWQQIKDLIHSMGKTGSNYSAPFKAGNEYFFQKTVPEVRHAFIYGKKGDNGIPYLVLDPNEFYQSEDDLIRGYQFSPDGRYAVFQETKGQVGWGNLRIFDLREKSLLEEALPGIRNNQALWTKDGKGFYYTTYGSTETLLKREAEPVPIIKYHKIGDHHDKDQKVYPASPAPGQIFAISMSKDWKQLLVEIRKGRSDRNEVVLIDTKTQSIHPLPMGNDHLLRYIGNKGDQYFFYTNKNAPNGKVVAIQAAVRKKLYPSTIIPEQKQILAGGSTAGGNAMNMIGDRLVLLYRYGTHQYLKVYDLQGALVHEIELETGWIGSGIVGQPQEEKAWFTLNTFLDPSTVYGIDLKSGQISPFIKRDLPIDPADYHTENTYYTSVDGTRVPIFIAHKKGIKRDGQNPVFMYGYGFGGWVAVPWYQPHLLSWLEMGGIYVLPGVRGGGEFGDSWKEAGIRINRQNAIDDYISAAEYLIDQGYSSAGKIVANGWSASGSLAAAATMQRPELFGAALIGIPSMDLLRYEKFTQFKGWTAGYGSPEKAKEFAALYKWSPYHNIKESTCYPPMLITAGEVDPTTPPQHAYKFVAAMQDHQSQCEQPILLKIVWGGGHGFGTTPEDTEKTYADELSFLCKVLGIRVDSF